jgi:hypothetical protein
MKPPRRPRKLCLFLAGFFVLDFILLVGGWTLLNFNSQYIGYQQAAGTMLVSALIISFIISALACMRFSFGLSLKKSAIATLLLALLALTIFSIGGYVIGSN